MGLGLESLIVARVGVGSLLIRLDHLSRFRVRAFMDLLVVGLLVSLLLAQWLLAWWLMVWWLLVWCLLV